MRLKSLAALAAVVLLFAACGKEGEELSSIEAQASATPEATTEAGTQASATPKATSGSTATDAPAATAPSGGGTTPDKTAAPGAQTLPKEGRYVYSYKGKASDPLNPAAGQQPFDGEQYNEISTDGNTITTESTNSEQAGRTVTKLRLSDTKLEMLSINIETQAGSFACAFNPPLLISKFPVKPETYPTQTFKGEGNACDGKLDITIEKQEVVKDAAGTSHTTWRAKVVTQINPENIKITQNETRWVSPDLGVEIKSQGTQNGEFKSGASSFKFSGSHTSLLKQHP